VIICVVASAATIGPVMAAFGSTHAHRVAACSTVAPQIDTHSVVPTGFPLPTGVKFTWIERSGANTILVGVAPRTLSGTATFFRRALARTGTSTTWTDAEFGEAEARFSGPMFAGKWRVNAIAGCAGASVVTLSFPSRVNPSIAAS
jgi:hypothetical protein